MRISSISARGEIGYTQSKFPHHINPYLPLSIMEKKKLTKDCFKTSEKEREKTGIFRTQYACNSLKELLEGFGYELTKIQVRLNNRTESKQKKISNPK